jgi:hypothetical protein
MRVIDATSVYVVCQFCGLSRASRFLEERRPRRVPCCEGCFESLQRCLKGETEWAAVNHDEEPAAFTALSLSD